MRSIGLLLSALLLSGCSGLFLHPNQHDYFPAAKEHIVFEEGFIPTKDGEKLHYWKVPAQEKKKLNEKPKGLVIQIHGNAANLTNHVHGLGWLTAQGYELVVFDYRGFGKSSGDADLDGAFEDVKTAFDYITANLNPKNLPVYFYGQSLGGSMMLKAVSKQPKRWSPRMLVVESSFFSYTEIAREKMADIWLSWPIQWMAYLFFSNKLGLAEEELKSISPVPVYLFYSMEDPIVSINHGEQIFAWLKEPKKLYRFQNPGHINAMWVQNGKYREILLTAMRAAN